MKFWLLILTLLAGTAQAQAPEKTIRICDASGCSERARSGSSAVTEASVGLQSDGRLMALMALAERDAKAAFDLGLRFFRGDGVPQNTFQALEWMRSAGERGVLRAQSALGRFYLAGLEEMGPDPAEAERWLRLAAAQGDKDADQLLAEAVSAKQGERSAYLAREERRRDWMAGWYTVYPYHTRWGQGGGQHR